MDIKKNDEMILDAYVSRCIDNIIKHGLNSLMEKGIY